MMKAQHTHWPERLLKSALALAFVLAGCANPASPGDTAVDIKAIAGVTAPVAGGTPVAAITENAQYTGTVAWTGTLDGGKFAAHTVYTATITLGAKTGHTFAGVAADFFTVAGAETTNSAGSGVVLAVFPMTDPVTEGPTAFVAVTGISDMPEAATEGIPLTLTGTAVPTNATNRAILWTVKNAGDTGASINGDTLNTTAAGTVTVTATIANGAAPDADYTDDFDIAVSLPVHPY